MEYLPVLKEVDINDFHMMNPDELTGGLSNGAIEIITHGGQHLSVSNLPIEVDGELIFAQGAHVNTFFEVVNRLFNLGVKEKIDNKSTNFRDAVTNAVDKNPNAQGLFGIGYNSPEITIIHYNELDYEGDVSQSIIFCVPGYVTPIQFDILKKDEEYYKENLLDECVPIFFRVVGWDPIQRKEDEALEYHCDSFGKLRSFLSENKRIKDYTLPIAEHTVSFDSPLNKTNGSDKNK